MCVFACKVFGKGEYVIIYGFCSFFRSVFFHCELI